uniref:Uncharacterized protein n=1 Tax=Plectus sambesii TaxID=2011161 RepID=A0A914WIL4_9BILA
MIWWLLLLYYTYDGCEEGAPKPFCHAQHQINTANASEGAENDKDTDDAERDDDKDDVTERKGIEGEGDSLVQADEGAENVKAADDDEDDDNGLHMSDFELKTEAPTEDNSDYDGAVNVAFDVEGRAAALVRQAEIVQ